MQYQNEPLTKGQLAAYASPAIPIAAMGVPIAIYLPPFYAQEMGLGLTVVGLVFMLARIWDVVTDPTLGVISDRFPTRWGRRRHWIVLSVPIMLVATTFLFMPNREDVTATYLAFWMFILYISWTLLSLSHQAWGAELSPQYNERTRIQGTREAALLLGAIIVLALPSAIEQMQTENVGVLRVASMGWMVILLLPITVFWAVTKVGESKVTLVPEISWQETFTAIQQNKPLQRLLASELLLGINLGISTSLLLFLLSDILKLGQWSSAILLLHFFSGVLFIPFFVWISKKTSKHKALSISTLTYAALTNIIWFIPEGSVVITAMTMMILSVTLGVAPFLFRSMLADVVDEDTVNTGKHRTGLFYSLYNMIEKVGTALAIGITYTILDLIQFTPGEAVSESSREGFYVLFIVPGIILNLLIARLMIKFPIDQERQQRNRAILHSRHDEISSHRTDSQVLPGLNVD